MLVLQPKSNPPMTRWRFCTKDRNDGFTGFLRKLWSTHSSLTLNMIYANSKLSARGKKWVKYLIGYCDEHELFYEPLITHLQAMFHPPSTLEENVLQFLTLDEAKKILADLNQILDRTKFYPSFPALLIMLTMIATNVWLLTSWISPHINWRFMISVNLLPWILLYLIRFCFKNLQRKRLTNYVADLNR